MKEVPWTSFGSGSRFSERTLVNGWLHCHLTSTSWIPVVEIPSLSSNVREPLHSERRAKIALYMSSAALPGVPSTLRVPSFSPPLPPSPASTRRVAYLPLPHAFCNGRRRLRCFLALGPSGFDWGHAPHTERCVSTFPERLSLIHSTRLSYPGSSCPLCSDFYPTLRWPRPHHTIHRPRHPASPLNSSAITPSTPYTFSH